MPELNKSQREILDLAQSIVKTIPAGSDTGLVIASLFLVIEGALSTSPPAARTQCYEVMQRRLAEMERAR